MTRETFCIYQIPLLENIFFVQYTNPSNMRFVIRKRIPSHVARFGEDMSSSYLLNFKNNSNRVGEVAIQRCVLRPIVHDIELVGKRKKRNHDLFVLIMQQMTKEHLWKRIHDLFMATLGILLREETHRISKIRTFIMNGHFLEKETRWKAKSRTSCLIAIFLEKTHWKAKS